VSHIVGTVQVLSSALTIGPDSGLPFASPNTWTVNFAYVPAPAGTKFLILHFQNVSLPASNRLEVALGWDSAVDVFTSADGPDFWTRPINIYTLAGGLVPISYITSGSTKGSVQLDKYGRGESHAGDPGHPSIAPVMVATKARRPTLNAPPNVLPSHPGRRAATDRPAMAAARPALVGSLLGSDDALEPRVVVGCARGDVATLSVSADAGVWVVRRGRVR
jgi:hypothetical protein